jgi:branched-chain amino acid transport system ATP-binding protein
MKSSQELGRECLESTHLMSTNNAALRVEGVNISFGGLRALSDVYLEIGKNEVVGLIGPNGAGKTTLFNALCGLVKPDSGKLFLDGKEQDFPRTSNLVDLGISRTLQGVGLFGDLTVLENVMVGAHHLANSGLLSAALGRSGKDEKEIRTRSFSALERVYAAGLANRRADTLSYPDTKRVAIARALVSEPKILMLDEPAGGLGSQDIEWMNLLIRNLSSSMSVLLIEHHMDVVMSVCSKLYVLNFGEVIASGNSETVRRDPAVMAAYLGTGAK